METVKIEWDLLGAKLATLSDEEQGKFFRGFAYELSKFESQYKREMQMLSVREKLTPKEQKTLEDTMPCLWYAEK